MTPRTKKLLGLFILLPGIVVYMFAAAALGELVPRFWLIQVAYYLVAGIAWAFPVKHLIKWMNSPKPSV